METVIAFRFWGELGPQAVDAILGAVHTVCQIHELGQPIITFGDPPQAQLIPTVAELEQRILAEEAANVHAD